MRDVMMMLTILSGFVALFWVVLSTIRRVKVARMQSEVHSKLVEKIGSGQDFSSFLNSEAGRQLADSLFYEQHRSHAPNFEAQHDPYGRILRSIHTGVILLALGIAFLTLGTQFTKADDGFFFDSFFFFGDLAVALGAGFLISSWVSYRLSKKFGLINHDRDAEKPLP